MARGGGYPEENYYNTGSCQFFIVHNDSPHLDGQYAAFGHVIQGIEVVDSITASTDKYGDYNGTIQNKSNQAVITEMKVILYTEA
jgi:peptidyl-prolyl cis-trans isomerase B (cyclophilin B)